MTPFTTTEGGFSTADYVAFGILCLSSCIGGIWYSMQASRSRNVKNVHDYLMGGKSMTTFPVALSLIASYVSGVTILGTPAEVYNYGTQYWLVLAGVALCCVTVCRVYLPVFCLLRLSSSYEYLQLRFNHNVRAVASVLFLIDEMLFLPMIVYVPALAFSEMTGFSVQLTGVLMVLICGLYTMLGGLRAVVWTDSVQTGVMFIGVILVAAAGTVAVGGVRQVLAVSTRTGRASLDNWSFSPFERQTGWGAVVGGFFYWTCFNSVNQTMVQRYMALPTKRDAIVAISIFCVGVVAAISLCVWCGLAAWTAWVEGGCPRGGEPLVNDKMLPAFVTWVSRAQHLPGLSGVFLAGVFGAGLSSLSSVLNACSLVAVEDILRGLCRLRLKPFTEGLVARGITGALAVLSVVMLVVIEKLGGVLGVATSLSAIAASATCGMFSLGMLCWWVGPRGAAAGGLAGAAAAATVALGAQAAAAAGLRHPPPGFGGACEANASYHVPDSIDPSSVFVLFRLSFHWVAPLGLLTTLLVGAAVGWLLDADQHHKHDAHLFSPVVWRYLPRACHANAGRVRRERAAPAPATQPLIDLDGGEAGRDEVKKVEVKEVKKVESKDTVASDVYSNSTQTSIPEDPKREGPL